MSIPFVKKRGAYERVGCRPVKTVGFHAPLPRWCARALDDEGRVGGKCWRDMKVGCYVENSGGTLSQPLQAIAWFWYKRGLASCFAERPSLRGSREARELLQRQDVEETGADKISALPVMNEEVRA